MVLHAASGADKDVYPSSEVPSLVVDIHTAVYRNQLELVTTELQLGQLRRDLYGQLSSWRKDDCLDLA